MLRQSAVRVVRRAVSRRSHLSTSAQKRALNKQQLEGSSKTKSPGGPKEDGSPTTPPPPPPSGSSPSGNGNSSINPLVIGGGIVAVGGLAYYFGLFPGSTTKEEVPASPEPMPEPKKDVVETPAPTEQTGEETATESPVEPTPEPVAEATEESAGGEAQPPIEEVPGESPQTDPVEEVAPVEEPPAEEVVVVAEETVVVEKAAEPSVAEAIKELRLQSIEKESRTLDEAHKSLRANLDQTLLDDLEDLTPSQLKVRVVQLAAEMGERTKWEAVRLKEFLALKERETAEKYMELMQKQRLEMESVLAQRLREQEDALTRQATSAVQQKDASIEQVLKAATDAQQAEHEAQLVSAQERMETELNAKYETDYMEKMATAKAEFVAELESKVAALQDLAQKVQKLESALSVSRSFESGSIRTHRMSAAALALAEKLETSGAVSTELQSLQSVAGENSVIGSALASIPASAKAGVPTLSELQTKFEEIHGTARQAAFVPEGRVGLEGQLLGMVFSSLKFAPNPDDPVPEDSKDDAEYVLARARRHVQLGNLELAVEQLEKLKGQTAFTLRDWSQDAKDRIAINKSLHVIKLECAMMNESMINNA